MNKSYVLYTKNLSNFTKGLTQTLSGLEA